MAEDLDFEARELCPDDDCIGVLGEDGHCRECGSAIDGSIPEVPTLQRVAEEEEVEHVSEEADSDDDDRVLCADPDCIGLVGPKGACKECGKPIT